jgi:choline dehydrogenase-like flavoprotein
MLIEGLGATLDGRIDTDVCIIGAGPAGLTLASGLDGRRFRVAVVEAGGEPGPPLGLVDGRVTSSSTDFQAPPMMLDRLGGGANEWIVRLPWHRRGVRMLPLAPIDFESRPWIDHSGWPFGYSELEPYYGRSQTLLGLARRGDGPSTWEDHNAPRLALEDHGFTTSMERFPRANVFTEQVVQQLRASRNVTVHLGARVGALKGSADQVGWAELDLAPGTRIRVDARVFVLAAGGIENPRLLLSSRDRQAYGNGNDVVGRYYMDHHRLISGTLTPVDRGLFERAGLYDIRDVQGEIVMGKLVPTDELLRDAELLNSGAMLLPKPPARLQDALDELRHAALVVKRRGLPSRHSLRSSLVAARYVVRTGVEMSIRQRRFPPRVDAGWASLRGNSRRFETFAVEHQVEQAPSPSNRVRLGEHVNEHGRPVADLVWRWSDLDLASLRRTVDAFGQAVTDAGVGSFDAMPWDEMPELTTPGGAFHPSGGTRMHASPRHGVVDSDLRVHGVRNLFVLGSSTFPTGGYANPTMTIIALSIRLADRLATELGATTVR